MWVFVYGVYNAYAGFTGVFGYRGWRVGVCLRCISCLRWVYGCVGLPRLACGCLFTVYIMLTLGLRVCWVTVDGVWVFVYGVYHAYAGITGVFGYRDCYVVYGRCYVNICLRWADSDVRIRIDVRMCWVPCLC